MIQFGLQNVLFDFDLVFHLKNPIAMFVYDNFRVENSCVPYIQFNGDEQTTQYTLILFI